MHPLYQILDSFCKAVLVSCVIQIIMFIQRLTFTDISDAAQAVVALLRAFVWKNAAQVPEKSVRQCVPVE